MMRGPFILGVIVTSVMPGNIMIPMRPIAILLLVAALTVAAAPARAQTAQAIEVGAITAFDDGAWQVGFRASPARPDRFGADIYLGTFPEALVHGFVLLLMELDGTYGAPLGKDVTLFPRAGGSLIVGGGGGGSGGAFGYNVGVGILGRVSPTLGVRADYTYHHFMNGDETLSLSSVSIGIAWIH